MWGGYNRLRTIASVFTCSYYKTFCQGANELAMYYWVCCCCCCCCCCFLVHRDLKPHNILIFWKLDDTDCCIVTAKISDLGLSKRIPKGGGEVSVTKGLKGTLGWAAPEISSADEEKKRIVSTE